MTVTKDDFNKIWASTSSVPTYTFSDTDYQNGWEFVGNLPPTRAMWDELQRRNDEKMQLLYTGASFWVDSVADLRSADAEVGNVYATKGYYAPNDGGNGFYVIRADAGDTDDGGSIIILDNGNVAELIIGDTVNVHQFGAKGNANCQELTTGNFYETADLSSAVLAPYYDNVDTTSIEKWYVSATFTDEGIYEKDSKYYHSATATEAVYEDNVNGGWYVSATFTTEGTYVNPDDGQHYVNYDPDTQEYTVLAPYYDNIADKWYVSATYTDEGTYNYDNKYWYITDGVEAPYYDNVGNKWYVSAVYTNQANAKTNGKYYYGATFSTPAQDDTSYIQNAINTHKPIELLNGHTYVVTSVTIFPGFILHGNGATVAKPNLKLAPYNYTDSQIKNLRMFVNSGANYNDVQTEIRDVTINGNAFSMWNPLVDNKYKYEQAVFFMVNGTADYHLKIWFDNVHFVNHFASSITINNYADVIITNSSAYNCLKGICTCVGDGNTLNMDNVSADSQYDFTAFWVEVNSSIAGQKTNYNINNAFFNGSFEFLSQVSGVLNLSNSYINTKSNQTMRSAVDYSVNVSNCRIIGPASSSGWLMRGRGTVNVNNCDISCTIAFLNTASHDYYVKFNMNNCFVHDVAYAVGTENSVQAEIIINGCRFYNISSHVFGRAGGNSKWQCKNCLITNCVIDTDGYIYSATGSGSVPFVMGGGNDIINPNCQGFNLYGGEQLTFKDEYWSAPAKIKTYRSGSSWNPIGFGKRTTFVTEAPTWRGVNDIDHAQLTVSPYTKYSYTNNAWVADA